MVVADTGEDAVVCSEAGDYGANIEKAETGPLPEPWAGRGPRRVWSADAPTPGKDDIERRRVTSRRASPRIVKTMIRVRRRRDGERVRRGAADRGDLDSQRGEAAEAPLGVEPRCSSCPRRSSSIATGDPTGFVGPHGCSPAERPDRRRRVDPLRGQRRHRRWAPTRRAHRSTSRRCGAGRERSQESGDFARRAPATHARPVRQAPLDRPRHRGRPHLQARDEVLRRHDVRGTPTTRAEDDPVVMGSYGIGVGRTMAAAVEQHHDDDGIVWPLALAPFEVRVVSLNPRTRPRDRGGGRSLRRARRRAGVDVFYDDRDERPGVKFKDADLIGFPSASSWARRSEGAERSRTERSSSVLDGSRRHAEDSRPGRSAVAEAARGRCGARLARASSSG